MSESTSPEIPRIIRRPMPNGVTYDLMTPGKAIITLPQGSTWTSGLHWHESHIEYLQLLSGSIKVQLGNDFKILTASPGHQPEIRVDRYMWHEWQRASPTGEEVVVAEKTDPDDGHKFLFFCNLNGVILNSPKMLDDPGSFIGRCPFMFRNFLLESWITLNLYVIFYHLDNFPVFYNLPGSPEPSRNSQPATEVEDSGIGRTLRLIDWITSHLMLFFAAQIGWLLNARPVRLKYTPAKEYTAWMSQTKQSIDKDD